jgi:hypothetical protein
MELDTLVQECKDKIEKEKVERRESWFHVCSLVSLRYGLLPGNDGRMGGLPKSI